MELTTLLFLGFFCGSSAFELYPAPCSAPLLSAGCQLPVLLLGGQRPPAGTGFDCGNTGHMGLRAGDRQMPDRSRAGDFPLFGGVHLCGAFVLLQILEPVGGRYPERHGIAAPHGYGYPRWAWATLPLLRSATPLMYTSAAARLS